MITDAKALRIGTVPHDMLHREGAIDLLSAALDPHALTTADRNVCIYGPSGAGKTTLAKYVRDELQKEILDVQSGYTSCLAETTAAGVLHRIVRETGLGNDLQRRSTPTGTYLDRLREYDGPLVAILDEVDGLDDPSLLATLADMRGLSLVTICVAEDQLHHGLDERVKSRLRSAERITLDRYSHTELVDILDYRVAHGLDGDRVDGAAVALIADLAAGNARVAIALLRQAATYVRDNSIDRLTTDVVETVEDDTREELRDRHVRSLGTHQRLLYDIVAEAGEIGASELHDAYEERASDPKSRRTRRRYLKSLERYNLIESAGETRTREYSAV